MDRHELERYVYSLEEEIKRRDKWLINSIWNVVQSLNTLVFWLAVVAVFSHFNLREWWHGALAGIAYLVFLFFDTARRERLEADDRDRIGRDSVIDAPFDKVRD